MLGELINPLHLSPPVWISGFVAVRIALLVGVEGCAVLIGKLFRPLPTRTGEKLPYLHPLGKLDLVYLVLNAFVEYIFVNQLLWLIADSPHISVAAGCIGISNSLLATWLLLIFDDMLYAPTHRLMHLPRVYKYVHKHHHRNTFPSRGYLDAANEHPVEQVIALALNWIAIHLVMWTSGVHAVALITHLTIKAFGACLNHTGRDVRVRFLGIDYSVGAHEMHHRRPNTNFAQYVMFWDRLMGTHAPYVSTDTKGAS